MNQSPRFANAHPPRVLLTKIGLDGHDRGSRVIASFLRDAGMEVIYTPPWQSIAAVVQIALQEDAELIGISSLATEHLTVPKLIGALRDAGLGRVPVVVGGIVPDDEVPPLLQAGVADVVGPGADREEIVSLIAELVAEYRSNLEAAE